SQCLMTGRLPARGTASALSFLLTLRRSRSIPSVERDGGERWRGRGSARIGNVRADPRPGLCVSPEELRREDEATCAGYGFHPGTDAFATCLQRESLARRALTAYPAPPYWGYWGRGWGGPYWP